MTTATITPKATATPKVAAKAAKAATDATEAATINKLVEAFKSARANESAALIQLDGIANLITAQRVYMVRAMVQLGKYPAYQRRGTLNGAACAKSFGIPVTSLANHKKALAVFVEKGVEIADSEPAKWEIDAVTAAWGAAAAAVAKSAAKPKTANSNTSSNDEDDSPAGGEVAPKGDATTRITTPIEDATAMIEALDRMTATFAKTWSESQLNATILNMQVIIDRLETISTGN